MDMYNEKYEDRKDREHELRCREVATLESIGLALHSLATSASEFMTILKKEVEEEKQYLQHLSRSKQC